MWVPRGSSPVTGLAMERRWSMVTATLFSMPRFRARGLAPAATFFRPSRTMAWPRTVAGVVPSPAASLGLGEISFARCPSGRTYRQTCGPAGAGLKTCSYVALLDLDLAEDVALGEDDVLFVLDLDLLAGVLGIEDAVADADLHGDELAVVAAAARGDGGDLAPVRLLL